MQNDYHISTTLKLDRSITNPYPFFPLLWGEMFIIIKTMICFLFVSYDQTFYDKVVKWAWFGTLSRDSCEHSVNATSGSKGVRPSSP